jgi:RNA polymerase sigma-70 factor (ECF subfamily)
MGPAPTPGAVLTAYARIVIKSKARQLSRRSGFSRSDEEDLVQELTLRLLEKEHLYDPARGATLDTFADRVITSSVKMILRDRRRLKRAAGFTAVSLESTTVIIDGRPVYLTEAVGDVDLTRVTLAKRHGPDPAADLAELLDGLPPELVDVAYRLQDGTVASVARDMGTSRRQVYAAMARIRQHFQDTGLARD